MEEHGLAWQLPRNAIRASGCRKVATRSRAVLDCNGANLQVEMLGLAAPTPCLLSNNERQSQVIAFAIVLA
jgi:hypothetical protein